MLSLWEWGKLNMAAWSTWKDAAAEILKEEQANVYLRLHLSYETGQFCKKRFFFFLKCAPEYIHKERYTLTHNNGNRNRFLEAELPK